jgi:Uma2 family endonuclease
MGMPAVERRWTAREVRQLIADNPRHTPRYELVEGELLVTPSPGNIHQRLVLEIAFLLRLYLDRSETGFVSISPSDIELEPETIVQPDVYVAPMSMRQREFPLPQLLLAVEVLSPSSSRHDRVRKRPLYQRRVPEYWIIDADARLFERWRPDDERPELLSESIEWTPDPAAEPFALDLKAFFAGVLD